MLFRSGIILLLVTKRGEKILFENKVIKALAAPLSFIGVYSYSIYLWHLTVQNILLRFISDLRLESLLYMVLSIAAGILASFSVERPMLRLRDRYFPGMR